ncbi:MAG: molybdopterin-dependent oxidoreductase [Caldilineaceae bacterium]|nr:molybdopterin-dependent oxidoreductase [Caldilineaceae bacterium]
MDTITLDGREVEFAPGATVMETALRYHIEIPRLCYHPELRPSGGCRLCLVEVEGRPNPVPSCGLVCQPGMVIHTQSDALRVMRRDIIDLFISEHPLNCVTCDKSGACDLQRYAYAYGISATTFDFEVARTQFQDDNPFFVRDHQYCILCGKCVRVCDEVVGLNAIDYAGRGFDSHIATPFDGLMIDSSCVFCGSCVQVCPTAALLPKSRLGQGREWELTRKRTICGYCGVGCGIEFALKDERIVYAQGYADAPVNGEFLCVKGRSGWDFISSPDRLTRPLVRKDLAYKLGLSDEPWELPPSSPLRSRSSDAFIEVGWETALDITATALAQIITDHGPDAVGGLASARCTNEENYLFQKFMRAGVGTNNVDHCARLCHASTVTGLGMAFGSGAMTNTIRGLRDADCILITGSNTAESHPVISYEVVRAVKKGASLIVIDPRRVPMVDHATLWLQPTPGTDIYVFLAMMHLILREGWADQAFIKERTEGFAAFAKGLEEYTPEVAALHSGVPAEEIERAARLYALGQRTSIFGDEHREDQAEGQAAARGRSAILYAMGITQRTNGTDLVLSLANLSMLCGQIGKDGTGVNPLRGQANVQGACDVAALPNVLPGYQPMTNDSARLAVAARWGLDALPAKAGLTVVEMTHAAEAGKVRAMYIMGENPMLSDPNIGHVEVALRSLDFLVVQDIFLSETAQLAHVVLPAAASLEKDGTFTNTERRVQLLQPVLDAPGQALPDWQIIAELAERLDAKLGRPQGVVRWRFPSTAAIMEELAQVTPIYGGLRHARLAGAGLTWPCPAEDHPGTPVLHTERFSRGLAKFHGVEAQAPAEQPDTEYPLILSTGRILYHYHTGTMTRRSAGLDWREPRGYAEINEVDAAAANIRDGGPVVIRSRRGQVRTQARVSNRVQPGVVFLSFHWKEAPANLLTQDYALDPLAKIPEYKVSAVRVENPSQRKG